MVNKEDAVVRLWADGASSEFEFNFSIDFDTDLKVYAYDTSLGAGAQPVELKLGDNYTVSAAVGGYDYGGKVAFRIWNGTEYEPFIFASTVKIIIARQPEKIQTSAYQHNETVSKAQFERDLDRFYYHLLDVWEHVKGVVRRSVADDTDMILPPVESRKGKGAYFSQIDGSIISGDHIEIAVSDYMAQFLGASVWQELVDLGFFEKALTYDKLKDGFDDSDGTGFITDPSDPSISITLDAELKSGTVVLSWNGLRYLTNCEKYEIERSKLGPSSGYIIIQSMTYPTNVGFDRPPLDYDVVTGEAITTTYWYRVRGITYDGRTTGYSNTKEMAVPPVSGADIEAGSISTLQLETGVLNALLANIKNTVLIGDSTGFTGFSGTGTQETPEVGDRRMFLDRDELSLEEWDGTIWSQKVHIGGPDNHGIFTGGLSASSGLLVVQGETGLVGPEGPTGPIGEEPAHEWSNTQLRFQNPDGSWGSYTDLEGEAGFAVLWSSGTYPANSIVSYNSFIWRAKVETNGEPGVSADWEKFTFAEDSDEFPLGTISFWDKSLEAKTKTVRSAGTRTDDSTYAVLVDSAATFITDGVIANDILWTDSDLPATVVSVDSETQVTLDYDPEGLFSYTIYQQPDIQPGWIELDGQTINDVDSPFNGMTVQDVIGEERFIRARQTAGRLQVEATAVNGITTNGDGAHRHTVVAATGGSAVSHSLWDVQKGSGYKHAIYTGYGSNQGGHNHSLSGDPETRPINISAIPILKIKNSSQTKLATYYEISGGDYKDLQKLGTLEREDKLPVWDVSSQTYQHITPHDVENLISNSSQILNIQYDSVTRTFSTAWSDGRIWESVLMPAGAKFFLWCHVPMRNDDPSWGGGYLDIQYSIDGGAWQSFGESGYTGPMVDGGNLITEYNNMFYFDFSAQLSPFNIQFKYRHKSYGGTLTVNGSHDITGDQYFTSMKIFSARGTKGDPPAHQWDGTKLQFEQADGTWGSPRDLQAPSVVAQQWSSTETYSTNDIVDHNGQLYISIADSNTEEPSGTATDWEAYSYYAHVLDLTYPVGYTYMQLPGKDDPATLGLPGTWDNISTQYAGDFFRVEGGNALAFGGGEQGDATRKLTGYWCAVGLTRDMGGATHGGILYDTKPTRTNWAYGGAGYNSPYQINLDSSLQVPTASENVVVNQTMRIWERIS